MGYELYVISVRAYLRLYFFIFIIDAIVNRILNPGSLWDANGEIILSLCRLKYGFLRSFFFFSS